MRRIGGAPAPFGEDPAVARRDPTLVRDLLPHLLAGLARESGSAGALAGPWREAAGELIANNARPLSLREGTLTVAARTPQWEEQIRAHAAELCQRLGERLGRDSVRAIRVVREGRG